MKLTLPLPPSANRYWRRAGHTIYLSAEAKQFKAEVYLLGKALRLKPLDGPVRLTAYVFRKIKAGDLMNREKVLSDSLQGVAYFDDSQIVEAHFYLGDDKKNPRVEVEIESV